jgi:general secretion pathway protein D
MPQLPVPLHRRAPMYATAALVLLLIAPTIAQQTGQRITPNFKDADIGQLIEAVSAATGKSFIIDPRVKAQITWISGAGTSMTPEQFYQGFLSVLQVHGFVAVPAGSQIKILPDTNMRQLPGDYLPNRVSATSDDVVTQVITVANVNATQLVPVLRPLMPQNAQLSAVTGANMLVISDRAANVNRMARIIARIDQSGGSDIDVIPLQSATAADTVRVLTTLIGQTGAEAGGATLRLVADDRSNSVLISGDAAQRLRLRALIANLDTPLDTGGETFVRYLNYAKAEDLASKLKEQISGNGSSSGGTTPRGPVPNVMPQTPVNAASAATVSLAGGTGTIWADKETNALIITAPQRTMRAINAVIDKLDIRRAQGAGGGDHREVCSRRAPTWASTAVSGRLEQQACGRGFIEPIGGSSIIDLATTRRRAPRPMAVANGTTWASGGCRPRA